MSRTAQPVFGSRRPPWPAPETQWTLWIASSGPVAIPFWSTMDRRTNLVVVLAGLASAYQLAAADQAPKTPLFERDVFPIFTARCFKCHGLEARKSGLDLRTPPLVFRGTDKGPVVTKGSAVDRGLFQKVSNGSIPPGEEKKLTAEEIDTVRRWIDGGAQFAKTYGTISQAEARPVTDSDRKFWSFRKPVRPEIPKTKQAGSVRTPIDAFLLAKLEEKGLGFS